MYSILRLGNRLGAKDVVAVQFLSAGLGEERLWLGPRWRVTNSWLVALYERYMS